MGLAGWREQLGSLEISEVGQMSIVCIIQCHVTAMHWIEWAIWGCISHIPLGYGTSMFQSTTHLLVGQVWETACLIRNQIPVVFH
jgi:hypothetical protein